MIKKYKLSPKGVKAYEKMSGFKTTGDVEVSMVDDATMDIYSDLIASTTRFKEANKRLSKKRDE